jgi:glutamate--cysteine ligase regulatory subunit
MTGTPSVIRRPTFEKSNTELTSSLRANFTSHQSSSTTSISTSKPSYQTWTTQQDSTLYIPTHTPSPLSEPRESYDITVKLFYLPNIPASRRCSQTREAIDQVLRELGTTSIDLLIISFPGISFDADDEDSDIDIDTDADATTPSTSAPDSSRGGDDCEDSQAQPEDISTISTTWQTLEKLHDEGLVSKLGISEFGCTRLEKFLPQTRVRPSVDQINVRDCCVVPKPLILYAKKEGVELLTHTDCTNVLPRGTLREILGDGEKGVGVLKEGDARDGLRGDVEPQWVVKYTAVVKDRGVVESKGYFAVAELRET